MFVLGTAGHVDHGKSTLVYALTGINPDRLPEEKEREMTVDLGFAWLKLPGGRDVSIVDVPGHERFIKNMLAGVGGIDVVLLIVAADEGVMPQTREHLAIVDLLGIDKGIVVITKKDLVDQELLELVTMDIQEAVKGTTLARAQMMPVSSVSREGLPELLSAIDLLLDTIPEKRDTGRPRLSVDRVFTVAGSGTIVTGTLLDGSLTAGEWVEVLPSGLKARIRTLQTHLKKTDTAPPGSRAGVNLAGVSTEQVKRGDVLTTPGWLKPTRTLDVRLRLISGLPHPLRHNTTVTLHTGTSEAETRVRLLDRDEVKPGDTCWAQLALDSEVAVVKGDRFIIRSSKETLGGGEVVDPYPRRHRRFHEDTLEALSAREKGTPDEVMLAALESKEPEELDALLSRSPVSAGNVEAVLQALTSDGRVVALGLGGKRLLFTAGGWKRLAERAVAFAGEYHKRFPLRHGLPKEELRSRLKLSAAHFDVALLRLLESGALVVEGKAVQLPGFSVSLTAQQQREVDAFLRSLAQNPYSPSPEVMPDPELLNLLIDQSKVVKVSEQVIFLASAYDEMADKIVKYLKEHGKITVGEVRDLFQTSRKYALALMEYLDGRGVTRRVGDERVLK